MNVNALEETYESVELFDKPALFTNARIDRDTIPPGFFACDIREDDDGWAATAEMTVTVNHMGTVILAEPLDFGDSGYIDLTDENGGLNFSAEHDCDTIPTFKTHIEGLRKQAAAQNRRERKPTLAEELAEAKKLVQPPSPKSPGRQRSAELT
jgi:hypothetical protein